MERARPRVSGRNGPPGSGNITMGAAATGSIPVTGLVSSLIGVHLHAVHEFRRAPASRSRGHRGRWRWCARGAVAAAPAERTNEACSLDSECTLNSRSSFDSTKNTSSTALVNQKQVNQIEFLERWVRFHVLRSHLAHHLPAVTGELRHHLPARRVVALHRVDERQQHGIDAFANACPEWIEGGSGGARRQHIAQSPQHVLKPRKKLLAIPHRGSGPRPLARGEMPASRPGNRRCRTGAFARHRVAA